MRTRTIAASYLLIANACGASTASQTTLDASESAIFGAQQQACIGTAKTLVESRACRCVVQTTWQKIRPDAQIELTACDVVSAHQTITDASAE